MRCFIFAGWISVGSSRHVSSSSQVSWYATCKRKGRPFVGLRAPIPRPIHVSHCGLIFSKFFFERKQKNALPICYYACCEAKVFNNFAFNYTYNSIHIYMWSKDTAHVFAATHISIFLWWWTYDWIGGLCTVHRRCFRSYFFVSMLSHQRFVHSLYCVGSRTSHICIVWQEPRTNKWPKPFFLGGEHTALFFCSVVQSVVLE